MSSDIHWIKTPSRRSCPVCSNAENNRLLLEVPPVFAKDQALKLHRCGSCGTGFFEKPESDPTVYMEMNEEYWKKHYVEVGAGIEQMIMPI